MADGRAFTGTPDATNGNPIDVTIVTNSSSQTVDRQTVAIGDPSTLTRVAVKTTGASATSSDPALVVAISPNTPQVVTQGPAGASAWLISGPVTLATGAATIGAVQLVTGAAVVGALATGSATIGSVVLATGAAAIGSLATGTATLGQTVNVTSTATIGLVVNVTSTATIGYVVQAGPARTNVLLTFSSVTGVTTEALANMKIFKGGAEQASGSTYTVTTGKTFRIQSYHGSVIGSGASGNSSKMSIRSAATVTVASAIAGVLFVHNQAATANVGGSDAVSIPDGTEIASAQQVGVSHLESGTANTVNFVISGYEYTP